MPLNFFLFLFPLSHFPCFLQAAELSGTRNENGKAVRSVIMRGDVPFLEKVSYDCVGGGG